MRNATPVHICQGKVEDGHPDRLRQASRRREVLWWTINRSARPGDLCVFYIVGPRYEFVATGTVDSEPEKETDKRSRWYGHYLADVRDIAMLAQPVSLHVVTATFPDWGYLKRMRQSTTVPAPIRDRFLDLLHTPASGSLVRTEAIEGLRTETKRMQSSRSRRLRDAKLAEANGVCECCGQDFGALLGGLGRRVLQVHHRDQISARTAPAITSTDDLAVVCANCHALIHADPKHAEKVQVLARRLRSTRAR